MQNGNHIFQIISCHPHIIGGFMYLLTIKVAIDIVSPLELDFVISEWEDKGKALSLTLRGRIDSG